jgi:hypothetical protein
VAWRNLLCIRLPCVFDSKKTQLHKITHFDDNLHAFGAIALTKCWFISILFMIKLRMLYFFCKGRTIFLCDLNDSYSLPYSMQVIMMSGTIVDRYLKSVRYDMIWNKHIEIRCFVENVIKSALIDPSFSHFDWIYPHVWFHGELYSSEQMMIIKILIRQKARIH